ncbi:MAG TPA: helix-turn-helix domain-containing protein, partial [Acidimicrobiia bacterium]
MRFRLYPTPVQEEGLRGHCVQARFVWNLALEQTNWYRPEWGPTPGYVAQSAQ